MAQTEDQNREFIDAMKKLMNGWNTIRAAAIRQFPDATPEQIQQITTGAMNHALGLDKKNPK